MSKTFFEFFAGGGMVRAGLGPDWRCLFANDLDAKKAAAYVANWGAEELKVEDVARLAPADLPERADLIWGSFPCQDLSLAGSGAGLGGARSGTFWPFWDLVKSLIAEGRAPSVIALENVCGALTSHGGKDFAAIGSAFVEAGYRFGAVVIDAAHFLPQSRPRLFIIGARADLAQTALLQIAGPDRNWHSDALIEAQRVLPDSVKKHWVWWCLPAPPRRNTSFIDLIEDAPKDVRWHTPEQTHRLCEMMSAVNTAKVQAAIRSGAPRVGAVYRRTRADASGKKVQRAEIRFDDIAGCLRTPSGGSSRQFIMLVKGESVRSRLLSAREAARLMGLPDSYHLPARYNDAYHLAGDGVAVPVVRFLASALLEPLLGASTRLDFSATDHKPQ